MGETDTPTGTAPRWLQVRFGQLWEKYADKTEFTITDATDLLKESKEVVMVILSRLRKSGWITVAFDDEDFRRRKYRLNNPASIFSNLTAESDNAQNKKN